MHIPYSNTFEGGEKLANDLSKVLTTILRSADDAIAGRRVAEQIRPQSPAAMPVGTKVDSSDPGPFHLQAEMSRTAGDLATSREWLRMALEFAAKGER